MGLLDIFKGVLGGGKSGKTHKGQKQKCPNCGEFVTLDMERCPKCGVRIKSMFRMKCPKCKTLNELDAKKCKECGYNFEAELARAKKTYFICPICRYKSDAFLPKCPACGTRFM